MDKSITYNEYEDILQEIEQQPHWRAIADKEADYADGNQLDSELLRKQAELGVPPAVEDLIGPALLSLQGYEATIRTDWRVTPDGDIDGQDIADALNYRLNQAERASGADRACSAGFRQQIGPGLGWVEVSREQDPFKYPYRCIPIHRNEIHWDMTSSRDDLSDARWLIRQRWLSPDRIASAFPEHEALIMACGKGGQNAHGISLLLDGGSSTGLRNSWNESRPWTILESRWLNPVSNDICVSELWYRRWEKIMALVAKNGRVVEYDERNPAHIAGIASGEMRPRQATVARVRLSYWLGPHLLYDGSTPYTHTHFPYVPFWGFREDLTGVPYGYVRGMKYQQDSLNSGTAKARWSMAAFRVERTKGAVAMTDEQLRRTIGRLDSDIVLDNVAMAQNGARFEVKRDAGLTDQHFRLLDDARNAIERVSAISSGFMGRKGTAKSGLQEQTQVEQGNQSIGHMMDNFRTARSQVGELLLAMIVEDMGNEPTSIVIEGDAIRADRTVNINAEETDPETGQRYLSNDLQQTRLKVALEDVPATNSYRGQQLNALSEAIKSLPAEYQAAAMPFLASLMDVPFKRDLVESLRAASQQETPEQIEARIQQAVQDALQKSGNEIKERELALKTRIAESEIKGLDAKAVQIGVQAAFSAMQAGAQIAQLPQIAPIADVVMQGAGYQAPNPAGDDPNFPQPGEAAMRPAQTQVRVNAEMAPGELPENVIPGVRENTSPEFPPVPQQAGSGMQGIETPSTNDNIPANGISTSG
jgi:hypothetical protein